MKSLKNINQDELKLKSNGKEKETNGYFRFSFLRLIKFEMKDESLKDICQSINSIWWLFVLAFLALIFILIFANESVLQRILSYLSN